MDQGPMTEAAYYILLALLKPGHGYGMMRQLVELSAYPQHSLQLEAQ